MRFPSSLIVQFYFNPLPRKEGDSSPRMTSASSGIISIHSLVKRETFQLHDIFLIHLNFNPLPRKEGDKPIHTKLLCLY